MFSNIFHVSMASEGLFFAPLTAGILSGTILGGRIQKIWRKTRIVVFTSFGIGLDIVLIWLTMTSGTLSLAVLEILLLIYGLFLGLSLPAQTTIIVNLFNEQKANRIFNRNEEIQQILAQLNPRFVATGHGPCLKL